MSHWTIKQKREEQKRTLRAQIELIVSNSDCLINKLEVDPDHFGNVIVELKSKPCILRFIQDRGDVYFEKESISSVIRTEQQLVFTHNESLGKDFETLLKAIELKIRG
ncbi:MAG: hypothetical protein Q8876_09870 [Bacillota bacterium]|nr:hypothetical protein [Bacillota bacterium]